MTIKSDLWIRKMVKEHGMISNFIDRQPRNKKEISYGLSSYGYDMRCSNKFQIMANTLSYNNQQASHIDVKTNIDHVAASFIHHEGDYCIIPAHSFVLTETVEYFRMPGNVLGICMGKSTYARCGLVLNTTPLEPGWKGNITLEISNTNSVPVKIYANEGIGQVIFFESDEYCEQNYADKKGKYDNQEGITHAKI